MWIPLNGSPTFHLTVKDPTAGTVDASSTPTFEVYEDNSTTPMGISGSMTSVTTGRYYCKFNVDAANGFENTKVYNVHGIYTYGGVTRVEVLQTFRVVPAEAIAGVPLVDVYGYRFDPIPATTSSGVPDVTVIAMASGTIVNGTFATDAISGTKISTSAVTKIAAGVVVGGIIDCTAGGCVGIDWGNVENKTTTNAFTGTTIATTQQVDVNTIKTQTVTASGGVTFPAATLASTTNITAGTITTATNVTTVSTGGITSSSFATGAITATAIAADAIGASELAADAITEIQSGLATAASIATLQSDTDDIQTRLPAALVSGRMDSSVGAMAANTVTASALASDAVTEIHSGLATSTALATAQTSLDSIQTFTNTLIPAAISNLDDEVLLVLADTNELQTDWVNGGRLDLILDARASQSSVDTIDGIVDAILIDTGTTLDGKITTIDGIVDDILADTGTTLPATLTAIQGATFDTSTDSLEAIRNRGDAAWVTATGFSTFDATTDAVFLTSDYDPAKNAASQSSVDTVDSVVDAILVDTAEIGTAGAGLTNINLPNQTMDIVGNITGNLSGSVGSVTGGVTVTTNNDKTGYSITGTTTTLDDLQTALNSAHGSGSWATATGFATSSGLSAVDAKIDVIDGNVDLILEDTGTTIPATLAGLSTFDASSDSVTVGTNNDKTGYALTQTFPSNFASLGINASGHVSRVTLVDTTTVNTDMRGTNNAALATDLATVAGYLDTEIAAILADTNELQTDWADGGRLDLILDARASQSSVNTIDDFLDTEVAAIKAKTDQLTFTVANQVDANALTGGGSGSAPTAAENATAVWSAGTRTLSGTLGSFDAIWAKIKAWLGLLAGKTSDTVTRAEINATTAGATYNETTDSLEAIADAQTAGTTIVYPFESRIMDRVSSTLIQAYEDESGWVIGPVTVVDASDNPVDLSVYDDLKFIVDTQAGLDVYTTTDVTVSGDDDNKWSVVGTDDITAAAPAELRWALRGIGTGVNVVLGYGVLRVTPAATEDPA